MPATNWVAGKLWRCEIINFRRAIFITSSIIALVLLIVAIQMFLTFAGHTRQVDIQDSNVIGSLGQTVDNTADYTAQQEAFNQTIQAQEEFFQLQIQERQTQFKSLESSLQAELVGSRVELVNTNLEINRITENIQVAKANVVEYQKVIKDDEIIYQNEIRKLKNIEQKYNVRLEAAFAQANAIRSELSNRPPFIR